jgi:alpha,alpha-trehalose phosphorylase
MLTYGLCGMRDDDGALSFWPRRVPEDSAILRFPVTYRGQVLEVEVTEQRARYTLRDGDALTIHHEMEELRLTREHPSAIRPVSRHH